MSEASAIPSWAKVGARVRCVSDGGHERLAGIQRPMAGNEYTIRNVAVVDREAGCWLKEITNRFSVRLGMYYEPGWRFDHFEPVNATILSPPVNAALAENDTLRQAAIEGYGKRSAADLAKEHGVSRNTIIGLWYRARRAGLIVDQKADA